MKEKLKIIPLGGLNEIGKNMTVIEYGGDIVVIDCGVAFPDDDMLGVDLVIPDTTYLKRNINKLRGYVITHGHEDHIGAIPYVLRECNAPIYATRLTCGIIETKLSEHRMPQKVKLNHVRAGDTIRLGCFRIEFIHTNHSIADSVALAITTPLGTILHTGDFKIDLTPVSGEMIDLVRIGELGKKGLLALMSDSTNVERPGYTPSEKIVGKSLEKFILESDQRIIIATFASNVSRLQQILDIAARAGRKVAVCGRSMEKISRVATELGYLKDTGKVMIDISEIRRYARSQLIIVSTGSQGETMSALYRMAYGSHKQVEVNAGDRILIAASAIPGNEKSINNMVNELYKQGAEVIYDRSAAIHVSGHACQEDLKLMLGLCKPKYFIPVHGEYRMLVQHAGLAREMGVNPKNILITEIGRPVEISENSARLGNPVPSGRLLVDGPRPKASVRGRPADCRRHGGRDDRRRYRRPGHRLPRLCLRQGGRGAHGGAAHHFADGARPLLGREPARLEQPQDRHQGRRQRLPVQKDQAQPDGAAHHSGDLIVSVKKNITKPGPVSRIREPVPVFVCR